MQGPSFRSSIVQSLRRYSRDERGGTAIEYSLMLALIAMACLVAFNQLSDSQSGSWGNTANKAANAMNK